MPKKTLETKFTVYDELQIKQWNDSVKTIPVTLKQEKIEINQEQDQLNTQEESLLKLQKDELAPIDQLIKKIKAQIRVLELPAEIDAENQKIPSLEKNVKELEENYSEVKNLVQLHDQEINRIQRHIEIKHLEAETANLKGNMQQQQNALALLRENLRNQQLKCQALQGRIELLVARVNHLKEQREIEANKQEFSTSQSNQNNGYSSSQGEAQETTSTHGYTSSVSSLRQEFSELINWQTEISTLNNEQSQARKTENWLIDSVKKAQQEMYDAQTKISDNEKKLIKFSDEEKRLASNQDEGILKSELSKQAAKKSKHEVKRNTFLQQLESLKGTLSNIKRKLAQLNVDLKRFQRQAAEFSENQDQHDLHDRLKQQQSIQAPLLSQENKFKDQVAVLQVSLKKRNTNVTRLENEYSDLKKNITLDLLWSNPQKLIENLISDCNEVLNKFEDEHPASQSDRVIQAIAEIKKTLSKIRDIELQQSMYSDYVVNMDGLQKKYFQMCGLLWDQFDKLNLEEDYYFAELLLSVLKKNPVAKELAKAELVKLQLDPIPIQTIGDDVEQNYLQAKKNLSELLDRLHADHRKAVQTHVTNGRSLIAYFDEKRLECDEKDLKGLLKFHTQIFTAATLMTQFSQDEAYKNKFNRLINHNEDGKPSLCKKILGIALAFLSSLTPLSFLFTPPPVAAGICAIGGVGVGSGLYMFKLGLSNGTDKLLNKFKDSARYLPFFAPAPAPSAPPLEEPKKQMDSERQPLLYPGLRG